MADRLVAMRMAVRFRAFLAFVFVQELVVVDGRRLSRERLVYVL